MRADVAIGTDVAALGADGAGTGVVWLTRSERAVPPGDEWLSPAEEERAAGLIVAIRRRGWRLRRWTAKEGLVALLGPRVGPLSAIDVANRPDGAPVVWRSGKPLPVSLSLSDRAGWAACALAPAGVAVGCDLELIEPRSPAFVADWLTPAEQDLVARSADPALAANLVWSAKESALKVIGEGLRRPTRSVEVRVDPDAPGGRRFQPLLVSLTEGGELSGWWRRLGGYVLTLVDSDPGLPDPPTFLGGPVPR